MRLSGPNSSCYSSQWVMLAVFNCVSFLALLPWRIQAQAKTDPAEVTALNAIFDRWGLKPPPSTWNTTGDPCSGTARDGTKFRGITNPLIACNCSFENGTVCHIDQLKISHFSVTGEVPQELQSFRYLSHLNMTHNVLTGNLPSFIGNLTSMKHLTFAVNNLSGPIPKELGMLTNLVFLEFRINSFSGSLPSEIGSLTNLVELYIDSAGVSGEIPSTFGRLLKLRNLRASDNDFSGQIPDSFGDLTSLLEIRLHGNSLQGPLPLSLGNLTNLVHLQIGDLTNGSSSLAFIQNMAALNKLILRNCKISGNIPFYIGSYSNLEFLDLSFNNLTGEVPQSLFSSSKLKFLFLGNNSLSGILLSLRKQNLVEIDLSYNNFSGSLPSWVAQNNLTLNLVANNFVLDSSTNGVLPGLDCLQKSFPCKRDSPIWSSFAINCGSSRSITSSNGISYDAENTILTATSYFVNSATRWGVSNVGKFGDSPDGTYVQSSLSQFTNTPDSELYQTARISPSSLRYYGLGLENGNYTVKLQFSETAFENSVTWKSLGKRIFDIYIQAKLVEKDFNIRNAAGDTSFRAVERDYFTNVTENFLEIHFFWAGKGTCCIPVDGTYGPLISSISVSPNFIPTVSNSLPSSSKSKTVLFRLTIKPDIFSYAELRTATEDFNPNNKLGEGGFGAVFKVLLLFL